MAYSSSSHQRNRESKAFSGIGPAGERRMVSESSRVFDAFINHRGPDVKLTLATQLYDSLKDLHINSFLDSEEKKLGDSFGSTIETAILSAKVHIAIFSPRYAESPWCLDELVLMLQSDAKIIPVFYQVEPWELRRIETGVYADAFMKYEEKGRYLEKLKTWKEALRSISSIAGEEFNSCRDCQFQEIVEAVQKEVQRKTCLYVADYPVGLHKLVEDFERRFHDGLVEDMESKFGLKNVKNKAKMVGIFGMGGVGKTTLAKELCNRKKSDYIKSSFLFNVREADVTGQLPSLQLQLLKDLFDQKDFSFTSLEEGTSHLKDCLRRSPLLHFLIVVDDIDLVKQLDDLLVMDIFKKSGNCLIIVTTRAPGVLITAGITDRYCLEGMDRNNGRELFCWHAFDQSYPSIGYEALVEAFVTVCKGLPLSLQVLGRHVRNRSKSYWDSELIKASKMLHRDIKQRLRISFDSLDDEEKQVFMDVACFFVGKPTSVATEILKGSGWNVDNAIETLKDKCLLFEEEEKLGYQYWEHVMRMHDHLRDLGREMADELSPPHRLWRPQDLKSLELRDFKRLHTITNIRCFQSVFIESTGSQFTFFLGQSNICYEKSASLLWLQLENKSGEQPSIPSWIHLQNLPCLEIKGGRLKKLWKNHRQAPSQLKKLRITETFLKEFPDFSKQGFLENWRKSSNVKAPMSGLEMLDISGEYCVSKISISGIHYPSLKSIKLHSMKNLMEVNLTGVKTLNYLGIKRCYKLKSLTGTSDLANLVMLNISQCPDLEFEELCLGGLKCLERIYITNCKKLKRLTGISSLTNLVLLKITECPDLELEELCLVGIKCLERIDITNCKKLKRLTRISCLPNLVLLNINECPELELDELCLVGMKSLERIDITNCKKLKRLTGTSDLVNLVMLNISQCPDLEFEHLLLRGLTCLESITFDRNVKLKCFELDVCQILKSLDFCREELVDLNIRGCPKLVELPYFRGSSCLERITIDGCGIKDLRLNGCQNLRSVSGNFELTKLYINSCPELEEFQGLARLSCLEKIEIDSCEKLPSISGVEDFLALQYMRLSYCSNALIRNCIHKLKSVPTFTCVIGRAADGAESSLNDDLFFDADIGTHAITSISTEIATESRPIFDFEDIDDKSVIQVADGAESSLNENLSSEADDIVPRITTENSDDKDGGYYELEERLRRLKAACVEDNALDDMVPRITTENSDNEDSGYYELEERLRRLKAARSTTENSDGKDSSYYGFEERLRRLYVAVEDNALDDIVPQITTENSDDEDSDSGYYELERRQEFIAVAVVCFVVVVDCSPEMVRFINSFPSLGCDEDDPDNDNDHDHGLSVREGEGIITMVGCDHRSWFDLKRIENVLRRHGILKKWFRIEIKKGEEWATLPLLNIIVDRLHHS